MRHTMSSLVFMCHLLWYIWFVCIIYPMISNFLCIIYYAISIFLCVICCIISDLGASFTSLISDFVVVIYYMSSLSYIYIYSAYMCHLLCHFYFLCVIYYVVSNIYVPYTMSSLICMYIDWFIYKCRRRHIFEIFTSFRKLIFTLTCIY
jgi:hypothetical protein